MPVHNVTSNLFWPEMINLVLKAAVCFPDSLLPRVNYNHKNQPSNPFVYHVENLEKVSYDLSEPKALFAMKLEKGAAFNAATETLNMSLY